jgi:hypothetical protein
MDHLEAGILEITGEHALLSSLGRQSVQGCEFLDMGHGR